MKKILVIGNAGSGKSYLTRQLRDSLNYPSFYLDCLYWKENWTHITTDELQEIVNNINNKNDCWIMDGNYYKILEERFKIADTIFFMDVSIHTCVVSERKRRGKKREDIPSYLDEKKDPEFIKYIKDFKKEGRITIYNLINKYPDKEYHIFKTRRAKNKYIESLRGK